MALNVRPYGYWKSVHIGIGGASMWALAVFAATS